MLWNTIHSWVWIWIRLLFLGVVPLIFLESIRIILGASFTLVELVARWVFVTGVLIAATLTRWYPLGGISWHWRARFLLFSNVIVGLIYSQTRSTTVAWILVGMIYVLLFHLETILTSSQSWFVRLTLRVSLALVAGFFPVALAQVEASFADEEFFVVLELLVLSIFWLLMLGMVYLAQSLGVPEIIQSLSCTKSNESFSKKIHYCDLFENKINWGRILLLFVFGGIGIVVWAYRHSFYPAVVPTFSKISEQFPFLCGQVQPNSQVYNGQDVFSRILARVEANPYKGTPEYGMLLLGTGERQWGELFREELLREVYEQRYTKPAHSVKWIQYEAALRAYYYLRIRDRFPTLFSEEEDKQIRNWFAAINRRALTVEWVDLMYALAFSYWPEGPYENQEIGAGLLALLEAGRIADPNLSEANRDYLARNRRGWNARFRVTDDSLGYQLVWINNSYFQLLYTGEDLGTNARLAFEWLLLQGIPSGEPFGYNHPSKYSLATIGYLGAKLLGDPRYIWLSGRALEVIEQRGGYLFAQPGVEEPVMLEGHSPAEGSCLIYGDSGLPSQKGPLAPDKIVFRDGWNPDSKYLLVNLRFTGWHRYKATGTVSIFYQDGFRLTEAVDNRQFSWLPVGRKLFRDKRIPRENLNGLIVEKTGIADVLYTLTSFAGPWAQDPPYYAEVKAFVMSKEMDWAHIRLTNWRSWQHDRWIYFYHNDGPVVIVDKAWNLVEARGAIIWHTIGSVEAKMNRFQIGEGSSLVEVVLIPLGDSDGSTSLLPGNLPTLNVLSYSGSTIHVATVFLHGSWIGAKIDIEGENIRITQEGKVFLIPIAQG